MNARRLYCSFVDLSQGSLYQRFFNSKEGSKIKMLSNTYARIPKSSCTNAITF